MINKAQKKIVEQRLIALIYGAPWSVKIQARMHFVNNASPYSSSIDAISKFTETATSLGVKIDEQNNLQLAAPHGLSDVVN